MPVIGQPKYAEICRVHLQINENLAVVHSNLINSLLRYIGLGVEPAVWDALPNIQFNLPPNPVPRAIIPTNSQGYQITNIRRVFEEETKIFNL